MTRDYRTFRVYKRSDAYGWVSLVKYTDLNGNFQCYAVRCSTYYMNGEDSYVTEDKRRAWHVFCQYECETFRATVGWEYRREPPADLPW